MSKTESKQIEQINNNIQQILQKLNELEIKQQQALELSQKVHDVQQQQLEKKTAPKKEVVKTVLSDKRKTDYSGVYQRNKRTLEKNNGVNKYFMIQDGNIIEEFDEIGPLLEKYQLQKQSKKKKQELSKIEIQSQSSNDNEEQSDE